MSKLARALKKINSILFPRYSAPFYLIIGLFLTVIFFGDSTYINRIKQLTDQSDGFNIMRQLFIPGFSGVVGGYSTVVISSFKDKYIQHNNVFSKFMSIGFIAGVVAVNLLNPSGTVSQVMVLGLLAGLSGFSYLERSALVQTDSEKEALVDNKDKDRFFEKYRNIDEFDFNDEENKLQTKKMELNKELDYLTSQKEGGENK